MSYSFRSYMRIKKKIYSLPIRSYNRPAFIRSTKVLGIETSCDDTGCAVVNGAGEILGDSLYSQNATHVRFGGVNPLIAYELHRDNIEVAVNEALTEARLTIGDIDAIAVTIKPGLLISLLVGVKYAKYLSRNHQIPLIPIHHMEAHALIARMYHDIPFPFLVLLISGGNALLAVVADINDFQLLGNTLDNAPGEILDKAARRMKLRNITEFSKMAGGKAIESAAKIATDPRMFEFPTPLVKSRDCNFSFSGLKDSLVRKLIKKEEEHGIMGDEVVPEVYNLSAAFQLAIAEHIVHRTQRAIEFCMKNNLIDNNCKSIVVSGGVACNDFIFKSIQVLGDKFDFTVYRPPPKVCTDNGIMIAWNGIEKLKANENPFSNIDLKDVDPDANLGTNLINEVKSANLSTRVTRLNKLYEK